ncbi:hypothetical protein CU633_05080 [Bacillus sp. V3-13]|uniref:hypothetical protein n=1 Tax=Bacillus sp. V3-13 TaxID=2053728 RepID=UPI000C75E35A|nr:hypothetical protein [Bacillus sp. V3-13]PLR78603.1 hypothetical protein CU633_05080 [Bacillus sp. V3-13]
MIDLKNISIRMLILIIAYFIGIVIVSVITADNAISNSLFDYVSNVRWGGSAGIMPLVLGALPIFAIILPLLMDQFERDTFVLRIKQKRNLFYNHFIFSIFLSACFTIIMALGGIIASFILTGHINNLWGSEEGMVYFLLDNKEYFPLYVPHVTSVKVWAYVLSSRFLAILFIATCVIFLKLILKKNIYVFFAALVILGTDGLVPEQFSLFLGRARITLETWITPADQWFNLVYFVFGIFVLSLICLRIYDKKEFYD